MFFLLYAYTFHVFEQEIWVKYFGYACIFIFICFTPLDVFFVSNQLKNRQVSDCHITAQDLDSNMSKSWSKTNSGEEMPRGCLHVCWLPTINFGGSGDCPRLSWQSQAWLSEELETIWVWPYFDHHRLTLWSATQFLTYHWNHAQDQPSAASTAVMDPYPRLSSNGSKRVWWRYNKCADFIS